MQYKYNVYERINSGSQGLRKVNISPLTKEASIKLANYWRDRAVGNQRYIILRSMVSKGYEVHSVRTY